MSISSAMSVARSGLAATSTRADVIANNVANANTPGYVRRSVNLSEVILSGRSGGVEITGISRSTDTILTAERQSALSDLAQADILSSTWAALSARVGDTPDGPGLFSAVTRVESALASAALSPESTTHARTLLSSLQDMTGEFNRLAQTSAQVRAEADAEIAVSVDDINAALNQIVELNEKIAGSDRTSNHAASLMDERQRVLDRISEYLPVQSVPRQSGTIDVITKEGVFLVSGSRARPVEFTPSSAFGPNQTLQNGDLSGLWVGDIEITPGVNSYGAVSSGTIGGLFQIRDQDIPAFSAQLDTLAADIIQRLSADGIDPTQAGGSPGLLLDRDLSGGAGLAGRLQVNSAIDPAQGGELWRLRDGLGAAVEGPPGNSSILNGLLSSLRDVRPVNGNGFQGNFSTATLVAELSSRTGQARITQEAMLDSTKFQYSALVEAEQAHAGVDIDAEMQELLLVEQAYSANARVIEVASQMINRLMEI